jgi:hypothetical protein
VDSFVGHGDRRGADALQHRAIDLFFLARASSFRHGFREVEQAANARREGGAVHVQVARPRQVDGLSQKGEQAAVPCRQLSRVKRDSRRAVELTLDIADGRDSALEAPRAGEANGEHSVFFALDRESSGMGARLKFLGLGHESN